jgi:hypothetical protein
MIQLDFASILKSFSSGKFKLIKIDENFTGTPNITDDNILEEANHCLLYNWYVDKNLQAELSGVFPYVFVPTDFDPDLSKTYPDELIDFISPETAKTREVSSTKSSNLANRGQNEPQIAKIDDLEVKKSEEVVKIEVSGEEKEKNAPTKSLQPVSDGGKVKMETKDDKVVPKAVKSSGGYKSLKKKWKICKM